MSDRHWYFEDCPNCGEKLEIFITWENYWSRIDDYIEKCTNCNKKYKVTIRPEEIKLEKVR